MTAAHAVCVRASAGPGEFSSGPAVRRAWMLAAALVMLASPAAAQAPVAWEQLPYLPYPIPDDSQYAYDLGFLNGRGTAGPGQDTLVILHIQGVMRYAPGENNGQWGDWHPYGWALFRDMHITDDHDWFLTSDISRSRDGGRTWEYTLFEHAFRPVIESRSPCLRGQANGRSVMVVPFDINNHKISYSGGDRGTWTTGGPASYFTEMLFDVPASPALPCGRILENGRNVMYSDDGIQTWHLVTMLPHLAGPQPQPQWDYVAFRFAWVPREGHPYGGSVIGIGCSAHYCDSAGSPHHPTNSSAVVWRSDDGGATFEPVFEFTSAFTGILVAGVVGPMLGVPYLGPDGALYAGVYNNAVTVAGVGRVYRSWDAGTTWEAVDDGFRVPNVSPYGVVIHNFAAAADGRLYMATQRGIWRTVQPVVSSEGVPAAHEASLSVAVAPNPTRGRVTVAATLGADAPSATVDVFDLSGRILASLHGGPLAAGSHRYEVDTSGWAPGVYLARVYARGRQETVRITVAR